MYIRRVVIANLRSLRAGTGVVAFVRFACANWRIRDITVWVIVKEVRQKNSVVADRIRSGELRDIITEFEGIPPTDWRYNDKELVVVVEGDERGQRRAGGRGG